jgi:zinc and cadmium transporter
MSATLSPLAAIVIACLAGGALAIIAAAGTLALHARWISPLVSFAVGALLGAVFLELLPHALEAVNTDRVMATMLGGLLLFFLLEKLVLWRHSHGEADELESGASGANTPHEPHGRSGLMIVIGNSVHNFCDGVVIAASFLTNFALGTATALAIVAHAIPQQVGDFAVLMHSGYS